MPCARCPRGYAGALRRRGRTGCRRRAWLRALRGRPLRRAAGLDVVAWSPRRGFDVALGRATVDDDPSAPPDMPTFRRAILDLLEDDFELSHISSRRQPVVVAAVGRRCRRTSRRLGWAAPGDHRRLRSNCAERRGIGQREDRGWLHAAATQRQPSCHGRKRERRGIVMTARVRNGAACDEQGAFACLKHARFAAEQRRGAATKLASLNA